ncbi:hypothetical protein [Emcibacter sp. SYSU 3D8]|uniref:hypothetical protein n=1 Tax=Emcibacter sp. SYSU 3D8 TaxID=3133969 RepID=UPI0031FEDFEC
MTETSTSALAYFTDIGRILAILGAVATFAWGVFQFTTVQHQQAETRRIEARKPFLDKQLVLYTEATKNAATLATSDDEAELARAAQAFWSLYWGELALVEDRGVEAAMVGFGRGLQAGADKGEIRQLSLKLAHACRESLAESWGVADWHKDR